MKKVNLEIVGLIVAVLIHTNKQTTTLEVKELLRHIGYMANQDEISVLMNQLYENSFEDGSYGMERVQTDGHYTYSVNQSILELYDSEEAFAQDYETDETESIPSIDSVQDYDYPSILGHLIDEELENKKSINHTLLSTGGRTAINHNALGTSVDHFDGSVDNMQWLAKSTDTNALYALYDSSYTRDEIRNHYARTHKTKKDNVRAKRLKNLPELA